ncbi:AsmA family protein [Roseovarius sp. SYSU LYC5161]|uniref:AsmA family protein n=1 Tax=Roseovarius halophilus (ex Wu et al. 2025) TaxID=3376060 RepID=UPI00399C029B
MRWLVRLIGLLVIVAAVAVGSLLLLPGDRIAKIAADQISRATGRDVSMTGETRISLYPVLGVSTGRVEVANAAWSTEGPMLRADSLKVGVEPMALFGGDIRITGLEAVSPRILLEKSSEGRVNWELGVEGVAPSGQAADDGAPARSRALSLTLDRALITDASVIYADHQAGTRSEMSGMELDLRWPDYEGAASFDAVLRPAGEPIRVSGELDRVGAFIDGAVTALATTVEGPGGTLLFNGKLGAQPSMAGRLTGDLPDTSRFLAALGLGVVEVPQGLGRAISAEADITLTPEMRLSLREAVLSLDANRFEGAADLHLDGEKPRITAQLSAGRLDLSALAGGAGAGGGGGTAGAGAGWSTAPIDASALGLADGEIVLAADGVDLGDLSLGQTRLRMALTRSRAVFTLREIQAYDGVISGEFVANNRSGLSVGGDLTAEGIRLEPFLTDAMDVTRFSAEANGALQFLGVGQSVHAIMNSLSGEGRLSTGRGVISGIDLDRLMRSGDATGGTTVFDSLSASFTMQDGDLRNDDLRLDLPLARAEGEGRIGLGARDIDYWITPVLLEGENRKGLAIPVRIRGPWSGPRILPDLEKAIDLNFEEEKEQLKDRAREEINRAVEKELGVTVEEGQSVEDALKKKLEDEAKKELFKLFE